MTHTQQKSSQLLDHTVTVFDIGCRFGIHPTWKPLKNAEFIRYYAFDVDQCEISRLKKKYNEFANYFPIHCGFSDVEEIAELNVLSHHGQSSFFKPNLDSLWYGINRPSDAIIESTKLCPLTTLDKFVLDQKIKPDFLKVDTEGYDFRILKGAETLLKTILAIRCEVSFAEQFEGAETFSYLYNYLTGNGFQLANFEYDGRGVPVSYFCPNPSRYGFISGGEAVFVKSLIEIRKLSVPQRAKLILFGFFNNLEDLSHRLLLEVSDEEQNILKDFPIWSEIERQYCLSARKLMYIPGDSYNRAVKDFQNVFQKKFPEKHHFFESEFLNPP